MREWLDNLAGPQYATAVIWTLAALIALVIVLVLIRIIRNFTSGTFVAGGRNRKTRLAVMDATAIDSQRRLVLVRRDDVEHLILIGGPTDVVVEQNIAFAGTVPRPAVNGDTAQPRTTPPRVVPKPAVPPADTRQPVRPIAPLPRTSSDTVPPVVRPAVHATPANGGSSAPPVQPAVIVGNQRVEAERTSPGPSVRAPTAPSPATSPLPPSAPVPSPASGQPRPDLDSALRQELKAPLDAQPTADRPDPTLEDEMARLLGELSSRTRK